MHAHAAGGDLYETDTSDDKLTVSHMSTPERKYNRSLHDSGMDLQATQAGVSAPSNLVILQTIALHTLLFTIEL